MGKLCIQIRLLNKILKYPLSIFSEKGSFLRIKCKNPYKTCICKDFRLAILRGALSVVASVCHSEGISLSLLFVAYLSLLFVIQKESRCRFCLSRICRFCLSFRRNLAVASVCLVFVASVCHSEGILSSRYAMSATTRFLLNDKMGSNFKAETTSK
jgi:hypothetical protein